MKTLKQKKSQILAKLYKQIFIARLLDLYYKNLLHRMLLILLVVQRLFLDY